MVQAQPIKDADLFDSDGDASQDDADIRINEEYARRFEVRRELLSACSRRLAAVTLRPTAERPHLLAA